MKKLSNGMITLKMVQFARICIADFNTIYGGTSFVLETQRLVLREMTQ